MSQKIQLRRGADAVRKTIVFDQGEPVWSTDTKTFRIGDGVTSGGLSVFECANNSFISIIPTSGSTSRDNASGFYLAILNAKNRRPYNKQLGALNRFSILLYPGIYDINSHFISVCSLDSPYVDIIGMAHRRDVILSHSTTLQISSGNMTFKNLSISGQINISNNNDGSEIGGVIIEDCDLNLGPFNYCIASSNNILVNSRFTNCNFGNGFLYTNIYPFNNNLIENCTISGYSILNSLQSLRPCSGNTFLNSIFIDNNLGEGILNLNYAFGFDGSNLFKDCIFDGGYIMLNNVGVLAPQKAKFQNCYFKGFIGGGGDISVGTTSFEGVMENCTIDSSNIPNKVPIVLGGISTEPSTYAAFYNCTVIANNNAPYCVSGDTDSRSGLFIHSRFNKAIMTGITGLFGNQFNIVDSRIR